jgi:hypothetical protein
MIQADSTGKQLQNGDINGKFLIYHDLGEFEKAVESETHITVNFKSGWL